DGEGNGGEGRGVGTGTGLERSLEEEDRLSPEIAMAKDPTLDDPSYGRFAADLESYDAAKAERDSEEALGRGTNLPSSGLLSFYDRLREKILQTIERRAGRPGSKLTEDAVR